MTEESRTQENYFSSLHKVQVEIDLLWTFKLRQCHEFQQGQRGEQDIYVRPVAQCG